MRPLLSTCAGVLCETRRRAMKVRCMDFHSAPILTCTYANSTASCPLLPYLQNVMILESDNEVCPGGEFKGQSAKPHQ